MKSILPIFTICLLLVVIVLQLAILNRPQTNTYKFQEKIEDMRKQLDARKVLIDMRFEMTEIEKRTCTLQSDLGWEAQEAQYKKLYEKYPYESYKLYNPNY